MMKNWMRLKPKSMTKRMQKMMLIITKDGMNNRTQEARG